MDRLRLCAAAASILSVAAAAAPAEAAGVDLSPDMPFDVAHLPAPAIDDWNNFAWMSFIAANWPAAAGMRGVADPSREIGAAGKDGAPLPVVWMTSKSVKDVFLPGGIAPDQDWRSQTSVRACEGQAGYDPQTSYVLGMISKTTPDAFTFINQAPFPHSGQVVGPLIDQAGNYVRYDIRMSQSEFQYFLQSKYYSAANQIADVLASKFVFPPVGNEQYVKQLPTYAQYGTVEYKASWKILDKSSDIISRYFNIPAFIVDPDGTCFGPQLVGLTGLHVLRVTPSTPKTWFWSTFEQVDNLTVPNPAPTRPNGQPLTPSLSDGTDYVSGYSYSPPVVDPSKPLPRRPPVGVSRVTAIQTDSVSASSAYRKLLAGTVWENYQLIGVQFPVNPIVDGQPQGAEKGKGNCYVAGPDHEQGAAFQINECFLANTSMETYVQSTSCAVCHAYAAPIGVPAGVDARKDFQVFSFMLLQAQLPPP